MQVQTLGNIGPFSSEVCLRGNLLNLETPTCQSNQHNLYYYDPSALLLLAKKNYTTNLPVCFLNVMIERLAGLSKSSDSENVEQSSTLSFLYVWKVKDSVQCASNFLLTSAPNLSEPTH